MSLNLAKQKKILKSKQVFELTLLVGISTVLLLYLLFRSSASFAYTLPIFEKVSSSDIDTIRWFKEENQKEVNLYKKGGQWYIGEEKYPVKQNLVDTLLQQLSTPKIQDLVSQSGNLIPYNLVSGKEYTLEAYTQDNEAKQTKLVRQLFVGKSSNSGRYSFIRLHPESAKVYTLGENISSILDKNMEDIRDRVVMRFNSDEIQSLKLKSFLDEKEIFIEKKENKWSIPKNVEWGEKEVQSLVNRFSLMNAQSFLDKALTKSEFAYEASFTAKDKTTYTIRVSAKPKDPKSAYTAYSSHYSFPFTLNNYIVETMLEDFSFVKKEKDS